MNDADSVTLRDYLTSLINGVEQRSDERFESMKAAVDAAFDASEKAILKAEAADKVRFESFNEFNQRIDTILSNTVTRETMDALIEKLEAQINRNREDLDQLAKRVDVRQGELQGSKITMGNIVILVTVGIAALGLLVVLANYFTSR